VNRQSPTTIEEDETFCSYKGPKPVGRGLFEIESNKFFGIKIEERNSRSLSSKTSVSN
jgi:hypothetical protein